MKRKSVGLLGVKDRSKVREGMVTGKQGYGDEGETKKGKLEEDLEMGVHGRKGRSGEDPGKIHRSAEFSVQECQWRRERKEEDEDKETRIKSLGIRSWWGILWVSDWSDEGIEERGQENVTHSL